jgi:hypothetical protein
MLGGERLLQGRRQFGLAAGRAQLAMRLGLAGRPKPITKAAASGDDPSFSPAGFESVEGLDNRTLYSRIT